MVDIKEPAGAEAPARMVAVAVEVLEDLEGMGAALGGAVAEPVFALVAGLAQAVYVVVGGSVGALLIAEMARCRGEKVHVSLLL